MANESQNIPTAKTECWNTEALPPDNKAKALTANEKAERTKILKNVVVVSFAFMLLFTSYNSMENMQSSLNSENGTTSLAALYVGFLVSGCFLPSILMKSLKEKYTLVLCSFLFSFYMASQFYPELYLLVPTAVIVGLGAAALWSAKGTYITKVGNRYAEITGEDSNAVITRFFSIFYMFYQSTQVWGNLISSSVLSVGVEAKLNRSEEFLRMCGYGFCITDKKPEEAPSQNITDENADSALLPGPAAWQVYVLAAIYVAGPVLTSLVFLILLDPIKSDESNNPDNSSPEKNSFQLLAATLNHLRHPYQLLLIPLTIWSGVERAFLGADFTAAYVSCGLGIHMVGYIMICYGACGVLGSMSASTMVRIFGRVPVIATAFLINVCVIVTLIYWIPTPEDMAWFFVISGCWGLADAVWQTQINSLYGVLFLGHTEAGFSNCRLWEATGFTIAFACSSVLCISSKIIVVTSFLVLGVSGYFVIEIIEKFGGLPKDDNGERVVAIDLLILKRFSVS